MVIVGRHVIKNKQTNKQTENKPHKYIVGKGSKIELNLCKEN